MGWSGAYDISVIKQRRGDANRIGFAIQLCYMRYPGIILGPNEYPDSDLLNFTSQQLSIAPTSWNEYSFREKTRREHILELQQLFGYTSFSHLNHEQYGGQHRIRTILYAKEFC